MESQKELETKIDSLRGGIEELKSLLTTILKEKSNYDVDTGLQQPSRDELEQAG